MSPERWKDIQHIFETIQEADPCDRERILENVPPDIRDEIERLLLHYAKADGFLEEPLIRPAEFLDVPFEEPTVFHPGERLLERFEIIRLIGAGGMGEVYESVDHTLRETIALKTVKWSFINDSSIAGRFNREVQRSRRITHPNVVRIYDLFTAQTLSGSKVVFLTMELLKGKTLRELIKERERLSSDEILTIARQLCDGLDAAHKSGVLHRDLKSANIMRVEENGTSRVVITDFGLAQIYHQETNNKTATLSTGGVIGTLAYLSPELLEGEPASVSSDIYALGVVLYEISSGHFPFESGDDLVSAARKLRRPPTPLDHYSPELPADIRNVIHWCLDSYPENRPRSAVQVKAVIGSSWLTRNTAMASSFSGKLMTRRNLLVLSVVAATTAGVAEWTRHRSDIPKMDSGSGRLVIEPPIGPATHPELGRALRPLLRVALSQSPRFSIISDSALEAASRKVSGTGSGRTNESAAMAAARNIQATASIAASLSEHAGMSTLRVVLIDISSSRIIFDKEEVAPLSDLTRAVDRICIKIRQALGEDEEEIRTHSFPLVRPDTLNSEAMDLFARGLGSYYEGDIQSALGLMAAATKLDPEFAIAFVYQAMVHLALRREEEAFEPALRAYRLRDRPDPRGKNLVESIYYAVCGDPERSLEKRRILAAMFPNESQMHRSAAHGYSVLEKFEDALRHARLAVKLDPKNASNRMILSGILAQANREEEALAEVMAARKILGNMPILDDAEGFALLVKGDTNGALRSFDKLKALPDLEVVASHYRATTLVMAGRLKEVTDELEAQIERAIAQGVHADEDLRRYWLGQLQALQDERVASLQQARVLAGRPESPPSLFALRASAELAGALSETSILYIAVRKLNSLQQRYSSTRSSGFYYQAAGLLAEAKGKKSEAREFLERAYRVWPDLSVRWCLAEHLRRNGSIREASLLYEQIVAAKGTALRFDGVIIWICSLAMSAKCFCVLKNNEISLKRMTQFKSLWDTGSNRNLVGKLTDGCSNGQS